MRELTLAEAICESLREEMRKDKSIIILGEDVGVSGGCFGVTKGLLDEFGEERVRETPISEAAIVGAAMGSAMVGLRPVAEIMFGDFTAIAMDQILNQLAKARYMSGGKTKVPVVIRTNLGGGRSSAAQHSQSWQAIFMHVPGLKVVLPSSPYEAKGLLKTAIADDNPVIFFEAKMLYNLKGPVPEEEYSIPFGQANIVAEGSDITLVATSLLVGKAKIAMEQAAKEGISVELIDPRTLVPLDKETIINSVSKTGRLIIADEGCRTCGFGAELSALVGHEAFGYLDAPIERISTRDVPIPFSKPLEDFVVPNEKDILKAIMKIMGKESL